MPRMEEQLAALGLNAKEAKFYLYLLSEGALSASQIANELKESRTNTYMVLERLEKAGLAAADNSAVKKYEAANPSGLKELLAKQQEQLRQSQAALSHILPKLTSIYNLGQHKPGIVYLQGIEGYKTFLDDLTKTKSLVDLWASDIVPQNKEAWAVLEKATLKRKTKGVVTRALFHQDAKNWPHIDTFAQKGFDVRLWGETPLEGEIVIYDNKVALTVYQPKLIVTVVTNEVLAETFRTIFEQLWHSAEKISAIRRADTAA
jgi:sugar-specific transcriptional regulator TrmB